MPGLKPGGMNGHSDYGRFGPDRGYTNGNFDPYSRDDPYRDDMKVDDEPLYRRPVRNGPRPANDRFNSDHLADQNSLSDFTSSEPAFELDHLATFAAGGLRKGAMHVEDGLRKLRQMENTTGIWTMRCILLVERRFLIILDKNSGEELERFPVQMIQEPTAVFKNDRREIYNNLVLFTVMDDSNRRESHSDMHIFQSVRTPAQNIVDEIFAAKRGQGRVSSAGEAVLSEIFATHSIKIEGWEGQAIRREIAQATGVGSASTNHNTRYREGSTSTNQNALYRDGLASTYQNDVYREGSASTNQNALYREGSASANQNALYSRTTEYQSGAGHQEGMGHAFQQNVHLPRMTADAGDQNAAQTQYNQSEFGYAAVPHTNPSANHNAFSVPPVIQELGEESQYRSARYDSHAAAETQKRTHIVTQHNTTTTAASTNQAGSHVVEDGGISTNQQRDGMAESSGAVVRRGYKLPPPPTGPAPDPYDFGGFQETIEQRRFNQFTTGQTQYGASQFANGGGFLGGAQRTSMMARPSYSPYKDRDDEFGSNELLERDVQLLNHCFDDIEKFVARLQQAAEAYKELERRRRERGAKGKKNVGGDGMLGHRARPPPAQDFVDIFQKFKLAFNLLAKLKAHIHDPNAPELVHFLFTPLSLIYEASRDPIHGSVNLGEQAVAPVLTQDAKQLLVNCLTSKEIELWQALGKNWTVCKDEWKGYIPPYVPRFYDGWQPAPTVVEEPASRANLESAVAAHHNQIMNRQQEQDVRDYVRDRVIPFPPEEDRFLRMGGAPELQRFEPDPRAPSPPRDVMSNPSVVGYQQYVEQHIDRNYQANHRRAPEPVSQPPPQVMQPKQPPLDDNTAYLEELKRTGSKVYEVIHDRLGKNPKELTVNKGDYLQVLDSNRNWWKVRNYKGQSGFCPYTILKEVTDQGGAASAGADGGTKPSADQGASKRGDVKYF